MKLALTHTLAMGALVAFAASAFGQPATPSQASPAASQSTGQTGASADNTRLNRRDRSGDSVTPTKQPNGSSAVDLVAQVRKAIVQDDGLSVKAHNIKVVASNGVVTLRGPVASEQEKAQVQKDVANVHGVDRVDNQLDIDTH